MENRNDLSVLDGQQQEDFDALMAFGEWLLDKDAFAACQFMRLLDVMMDVVSGQEQVMFPELGGLVLPDVWTLKEAVRIIRGVAVTSGFPAAVAVCDRMIADSYDQVVAAFRERGVDINALARVRVV